MAEMVSDDICVSCGVVLLMPCSLLCVVDSLFVFVWSAAGTLLIIMFDVSTLASLVSIVVDFSVNCWSDNFFQMTSNKMCARTPYDALCAFCICVHPSRWALRLLRLLAVLTKNLHHITPCLPDLFQTSQPLVTVLHASFG
jgi:hypothetical protein